MSDCGDLESLVVIRTYDVRLVLAMNKTLHAVAWKLTQTVSIHGNLVFASGLNQLVFQVFDTLNKPFLLDLFLQLANAELQLLNLNARIIMAKGKGRRG